MSASFIQSIIPQRVVFAGGALARVGEEAERLGFTRALVIATPGSGTRLGARVVNLLGQQAAGLHAGAVVHVPRATVEHGLAAAREQQADGLVAVGGGAAIGLAKAIALQTDLKILAVPTTYSGSEATPIWGTTEGERKTTGRDPRIVPRTILYDPDLTLGLPAAVSAASGMNAIAHCVEGLWIPERTPFTEALAADALARFARHLPRVVADGNDRAARAECLIAAWLAGTVLTTGTGLHHKLAHVLGGLGLPHAETHAVILPHVTRFNLAIREDVRGRLARAVGHDDPAAALEAMLRQFPIPQRLSDVGFERARIPEVAAQAAALGIKEPRQVTAEGVAALLVAAS
jgi:maleylacetate reductase